MSRSGWTVRFWRPRCRARCTRRSAGQLRTSGISQLIVAGEDYLVLPRPLGHGRRPADGLRPGGVDSAVADRAASRPAGHSRRARGDRDRRRAARDGSQLRGGADDHAPAGQHHRRDARGGGDRRSDPQDRHPPAGSLGRRGRPAAGHDVQHADRLDRRGSSARCRRRSASTSLGRLSTVIAHEIRNPLMIIKASLHTLRQSEPGEAALREAVADIDDEVTRLNRIVNEVLDFSRPIRFDLAPADIAALCRESAAAAQASPGAAGGARPRSRAPHARHRCRAAPDRARQHARQRAARR